MRAISLIILLLFTSPVFADELDLTSENALESAVWTLAGQCDGKDVSVRLCQWLQSQRQDFYRGKDIRIDGDRAFLTWDFKAIVPKASKGKKTSKRKNTSKGELVDITSQPANPTFTVSYSLGENIVKTQTAHLRWSKKAFGKAQDIAAIKTFNKQEQAKAWLARVKARAVVQYAGTLPSRGRLFSTDKSGKAIEITVKTARVYDPCTGEILIKHNSPEKYWGPVIVNTKTCLKADQPKLIVKKVKKKANPNANLPTELTAIQLQQGLLPVRVRADECYYKYGVPGKANIKFIITGEGTIKSAVQSGDFVDTPTGTCIEESYKNLKFPKTQALEMEIDYPVKLQ